MIIFPSTTASKRFPICNRLITVRAFLLQEREVTMEEYLEFLNAPEVRAEIEEARARRAPEIRLPRELHRGVPGWLAEDARGWSLDPGYERLPASAISCEDAHYYAIWRTERAREEGLEVEFYLPDCDELEWAAGASHPETSRRVEHEDGEGHHPGERDQRLNDVTSERSHGPLGRL